MTSTPITETTKVSARRRALDYLGWSGDRPQSKQRGEDIAIAIMVSGLVLILGMLGGAFFIVAWEALRCLP